jgi:hypothetical protein
MMRRFALVIAICSALYAQRQMTVAQLSGFIKSSVDQHLDDKSIAETLKKTTLTEKLDQRTLTTLMNLGAGPRTSAALHDLSEASASMPDPAAPGAAIPKALPRILTAPDSVEQAGILDAIREYALNYTANLPNFICTQVTRRQIDPSGIGDHWQQADKLQEQLTYFEHKETYKVMAVNGQMVSNKDHLKMGGAITSGEFGSMMYEIFAPATAADFEWARLGKLDGRIMNVFNYRVAQPRSHYSIYHEGVNRTIIAGYHGLIYAARDTNAVIRVTLECDEIPRDFPVQDVKLDLWYDTIKISDQEFVLPVKWDMHSRDGRYMIWNSAEFALYRKFGAEATIKFDTPDEPEIKAPDPKTGDQPQAAPAKPPVKKQP